MYTKELFDTKKAKSVETIETAITPNFRKNWDTWQIVREAYQNAMDESEKDSTIKCGIKRLDVETQIVFDTGKGFDIGCLYVGQTTKDGETTIGKFGDGIKSAMIVSVRLGIKVLVRTRNIIVEPTVETKHGIDVVVWKVYTMPTVHEGTAVLIHSDVGLPDYSKLFVAKNDPRTLFEHQGFTFKDRILKQPADEKQLLFVKGIYVTELKDCEFSYDASHITLSDSRDIPSSSSVMYNVAKIWAKCEDVSLIKDFITAINNHRGEVNSDFEGAYFENKPAWKKAFLDIYGAKAVFSNSARIIKEATHKGAIAILVPLAQMGSLDYMLPSAETYLLDHDKKSRESAEIYRKDFTPEQEKNYCKLARMSHKVAKELGCKTARVIFVNATNFAGSYVSARHIIQLELAITSDLNRATAVLIHEMAHAYLGTNDDTEEHNNACCKVGAILLQ